MSNRHLSELRTRLTGGGWNVLNELNGEGNQPAVWQIQRAPGRGPFHLEFESFDKDEPAPIEQGYGVRIRELKQTSIYLYRKRNEDAWARVIGELLSALDELDQQA